MRRAWDDQLLSTALALEEPDEARFSEHVLAAARAVFEAPSVSLLWKSAAQPIRAYGALPLQGLPAGQGPRGPGRTVFEALHGPGAQIANVADLLRHAGLPPGLLREQCGWADAMAARAVLEDVSVVLCWATPDGLL